MTVSSEIRNILVIAPNPSLAAQLDPVLQRLLRPRYTLKEVPSIAAATDALYHQSMDVAFLDMTHPSGLDLGEICRLTMEASYLPVIAVVRRGYEGLGTEAIRAGVQDWLPVDALTEDMVAKSIGYAQERLQWREAFRSMSLVDDATGLYNATGFMAVATPLMERVTRQNQPSVFVSIDVLDLDRIQNDLGSHERQNAVVLTAGVLWTAFRRSDVVARINKESFGVLAIDCAAKNFPVMQQRIHDIARERRDSERWPFELRLRVGYVQVDKDTKNHDAETLMMRARSMAPN